jgi:DNA repair exonuclease SbcCD ATPase subunit
MLNSIIRLDVIDSVITMAKKKKSDIKNDLVATQKTMAEVTEKANQFSWLEDAKTLLSKAEGLQKDITALVAKKARLASLYAAIQENKRKQTVFQALYDKITPYIERMDVLQNDLLLIKKKKDRLLTMKTAIKQQQVNVKTLTAQRDEIQKTLPPICPECGKAL